MANLDAGNGDTIETVSDSTTSNDVQPNIFVEHNQRASVIVAQPTSSEIRIQRLDSAQPSDGPSLVLAEDSSRNANPSPVLPSRLSRVIDVDDTDNSDSANPILSEGSGHNSAEESGPPSPVFVRRRPRGKNNLISKKMFLCSILLSAL